jgi:hypothetical protein
MKTVVDWLGLAFAISGGFGIYTFVLLMAITDHPVSEIQKQVLDPALKLAVVELALFVVIGLVLLGTRLK